MSCTAARLQRRGGVLAAAPREGRDAGRASHVRPQPRQHRRADQKTLHRRCDTSSPPSPPTPAQKPHLQLAGKPRGYAVHCEPGRGLYRVRLGRSCSHCCISVDKVLRESDDQHKERKWPAHKENQTLAFDLVDKTTAVSRRRSGKNPNNPPRFRVELNKAYGLEDVAVKRN